MGRPFVKVVGCSSLGIPREDSAWWYVDALGVWVDRSSQEMVGLLLSELGLSRAVGGVACWRIVSGYDWFVLADQFLKCSCLLGCRALGLIFRLRSL
jgi:hypothetical protein